MQISRQVELTNRRVVKDCTIMPGMCPMTHYVMKMMDLTAMESGVMVLGKTIAQLETGYLPQALPDYPRLLHECHFQSSKENSFKVSSIHWVPRLCSIMEQTKLQHTHCQISSPQILVREKISVVQKSFGLGLRTVSCL